MQSGAMDLSHLSQVISHALAPAFLLSAVAAFVAILAGRMKDIIERIRTLNMIDDGDAPRAHLRSDIPRLRRRARLLSAAIRLALASGICTTLLVVLAFASALVGLRHEPAVGVLFMLALALLGAALFTFAREIWIGLNEFDHYA